MLTLVFRFSIFSLILEIFALSQQQGRYHPSYLLCPETYQWIPIEKCLLKLDKSKYTRLTDDKNASEKSVFCHCLVFDIIKLSVPFPKLVSESSLCQNLPFLRLLCLFYSGGAAFMFKIDLLLNLRVPSLLK